MRPMKEPLREYAPPRWENHRTGPDPLVWHEAAHALVGYRLGMAVEFVDMTGLMVPSPVCGLDVETVPAHRRAEATGLTALAGPVGEAMASGRAPMWRQDGDVAKAAAKALAEDMPGQMNLLVHWAKRVRTMLENDPAYKPLVYHLAAHQMLTGKELLAFLRVQDARKGPPPVQFEPEPHAGEPATLMLKASMGHPTVRKALNRGYTPIRYWNGHQFRHGWITERKPRGGLTVELIEPMGVKPSRKRLTADEAQKYVQELTA